MDREELLRALRRMAPETGSLHCLGCGHEHSCSVHGCAVVNAAVLEINMLADQNKLLREQLDESRLRPLTPQKAASILRDANLGGVLRRAADMGIRALTWPRLARDTWQECEACRDCHNCRYYSAPVVEDPCVECTESKEVFHPKWEPGFDFCPHCGRPLTEEAWLKLEEDYWRRIGGNDETTD